jgi:hypothetical protein
MRCTAEKGIGNLPDGLLNEKKTTDGAVGIRVGTEEVVELKDDPKFPIRMLDYKGRDRGVGARVTGSGFTEEGNRSVRREGGDPGKCDTCNVFVQLIRGMVISINPVKLGTALGDR